MAGLLRSPRINPRILPLNVRILSQQPGTHSFYGRLVFELTQVVKWGAKFWQVWQPTSDVIAPETLPLA
jgi:hypothetical protein